MNREWEDDVDNILKDRFSKERLEKQHGGGKLHAIERVKYFFNEDFEEFFEYVSSDKDRYEGVITGLGHINGRKIFFYSQDFTVKGGSVGKYHALKIIKVMDLAIETGNIVISFIDSGGARIEEGVDSLEGYAGIFKKIVEGSGWIPQISLVMGPSAGGAVYSPALTDFICMVRGTSYMFVNGPKIVEKVTGKKFSMDELGGSEIHSRISGVAHFSAEDEYRCMDITKKLMSYLPSNSTQHPPFHKYSGSKDDVKELEYHKEKILRGEPFDVSEIINNVLDEESFLEVHKEFARNILVGFGRIYGDVVGIVANNRIVYDGRLDSNAAEKASRFIRFCDSFNIPIISIVDTPGFMLSVEEEYRGMIRHVAKLIYAYAESTVPMITIYIGNAYGGGYISMGSKSLGVDTTYSWPSASIAVMKADEAFEILYKGEGKGLEGEFMGFRDMYHVNIESPYNAASKGYIDKVIEPRESRVIIRNALETLKSKKSSYAIKKKHGIFPV